MADFSRFATSKHLLHTQEKLSRYRPGPGGFHPVSLGDTFKAGRYKVYHKLGWGGFSTVWLARDQSLGRWVSLKITESEGTEPSQELSIYQRLCKTDAAHRIVQLLDSFVHQGPNGEHQCLVFELLGPTVDFVVADYYGGGDRLEDTTVLRVTRQLLQALAGIHRAGYAHGDISGANVAFTARRLRRLSVNSMLKVVGAPRTEKVEDGDGHVVTSGMPDHLVERIGWDNWIDEDEEDVRVIDFGETFAHDAIPTELAEPSEFQVPERIFTGRFDYRVDLWRAGCIIYTILVGSRPFSFFQDQDGLVAQMIHFVGELPSEWRPEWERMKKSAGREHDDIPDRMTGPFELEERFEKYVTEVSLKPLLPIIRGLMRFRPEDRISAEEALRLLLVEEEEDEKDERDERDERQEEDEE